MVFLSDFLSPGLYYQPACYTTRRLFPLIDQVLNSEADFYLFGHNPEPVAHQESAADTHRLKMIGWLVEQVGNNQAVTPAKLAQPLNEDDLENVDYFLAGLGQEK